MGISGGPDMIQDGLVLALDASDRNSYPGSGTVWGDLITNSATASLVNGPTFSSANQGSIVFDGTNDYGIVSQTTYLLSQLTTQCSVQMFIKVPTTFTASFGMILTNRSGSDAILTFGFGFDDRPVTRSWNPTAKSNNRALVFNVGGGGSIGNFVFTTGSFTTNDWVSVVGTSNSGSIIALYYNGTLVATSPFSGSFQKPNVPIRLANQYDLNTNDYPTPCNIANVQIYNRALSASEVLQNYNALKSRFNL